MVGIGKGAENGILIKDAESLETARQVNAIVLDKTGTLTEGHPTVTDISDPLLQSPLGDVLFTLESASEHPLAQAIVQHQTRQILPMEEFESLTGLGVRGQNQRYLLLCRQPPTAGDAPSYRVPCPDGRSCPTKPGSQDRHLAGRFTTGIRAGSHCRPHQADLQRGRQTIAGDGDLNLYADR